ncbi:hypothetical protein Bbelb_279190 [Branchiostoma belcheri]|nr:hypothetical protein Bbelb_279190 [Branchiostoma belcheri]
MATAASTDRSRARTRKSGNPAPNRRRGVTVTSFSTSNGAQRRSPSSTLSRRRYEPVQTRCRGDGAHGALIAFPWRSLRALANFRSQSERRESVVLVEWGPYSNPASGPRGWEF